MTIGEYIKSSKLKWFDFTTVYNIMIILVNDKKINLLDFIEPGEKEKDNVCTL